MNVIEIELVEPLREKSEKNNWFIKYTAFIVYTPMPSVWRIRVVFLKANITET